MWCIHSGGLSGNRLKFRYKMTIFIIRKAFAAGEIKGKSRKLKTIYVIGNLPDLDNAYNTYFNHNF